MLEFIADFYCYDLKLVIELDGYTHGFEQVYDKDMSKQKALEKIGLSVLRFADNDVMKNLDGVIYTIEEYVLEFEKKD